jgi:hypothetical protein
MAAGRLTMWRIAKPKIASEIEERRQTEVAAAGKIRDICSFASDSAKSIASYTDRCEAKYKKYQ